MSGRVVALLGAESTGKSTLARALTEALCAQGRDAVVIDEALRSFCDRTGRTPRRDEQAVLAREQTQRIAAAARAHALVVADTTAIMTAVYSELVFGDTSLYATAEAVQREYAVTLVTALDLPWQSDGLQRDGAHVREPVDAALRAALSRAEVDYHIIAGQGEQRLAAALAAVHRMLAPPVAAGERVGWRWVCALCGDPDCERHPRLSLGARER
jgi:nicotinamide riboside kinase